MRGGCGGDCVAPAEPPLRHPPRQVAGACRILGGVRKEEEAAAALSPAPPGGRGVAQSRSRPLMLSFSLPRRCQKPGFPQQLPALPARRQPRAATKSVSAGCAVPCYRVTLLPNNQHKRSPGSRGKLSLV